MLTDYIIKISTDLETLYLECYHERCRKIAHLFKTGDIFYFNTNYINNDFQKNLVCPVVLYITMLSNNSFSPDSILKINILDNGIRLTLYSDYDKVSGLNPDLEVLKKLNITIKSKKKLPKFYSFVNPEIITKINSLRVVKDMWELIQINDAIEKTATGFDAMRSLLGTPETDEAGLEAAFMKAIIERGFSIAYLPICAGDSNAAYIHYSKNNSIIENTVLLDCGARNPYGYCADITRFFIVDPDDYMLNKTVYSIVMNAKTACEKYIEEQLEHYKLPKLTDVDNICINTYLAELPEILPPRIVIDESLVRCFYTHFIGHHVGLSIHDPESDRLDPGSVFTIEPGLYFNPKIIKIDIDARLYRLGGIRIEDMYYISPDMKLVCLSSKI